MSKAMATKDPTKADLQKEISVLTIALEDALQAYTLLHNACEFSIAIAEASMSEDADDSLALIIDTINSGLILSDKFATSVVQGRETASPVLCSQCGACLETASPVPSRCVVCNYPSF